MNELEAHEGLTTNLRRIARRRGVSLNQLARLSDVSRSQLYAVLAGDSSPTLDTLARLAATLNVPPWRLVAPAKRASR